MSSHPFNTAMRILFLFLIAFVVLDAPAQDSKQKLVVFLDINIVDPKDVNSPLTIDERSLARKLKTEIRSYASADYDLLFYSNDEEEEAAEMLRTLEAETPYRLYCGLTVMVSAFKYRGYLGTYSATRAQHSGSWITFSGNGLGVLFTSPSLDDVVDIVSNRFAETHDLWSK